jgi:transposase
MNLHLVEIAATVAPGAHAVLLVDQAGWHLSTGLVVPPNITIMALPPKCPELNPVENVWQFLRDNWLSNRVFKSYDDLVDHCCVAWNKLVNQPWRIMSIGLRQWAHRFCSMGLGTRRTFFSSKPPAHSGDEPRRARSSQSTSAAAVRRRDVPRASAPCGE